MSFKALISRPYLVFIALFSIYVLNIFVGKISLSVGERSLPLSLSGIVEFLLLFVACIFFVMGILQAESSNNKNK